MIAVAAGLLLALVGCGPDAAKKGIYSNLDKPTPKEAPEKK